MKDLVSVKWTKVSKGETSGRYMCPITFKTFTNQTQVRRCSLTLSNPS
jgi:nitric oxide synthase-interacting protein